MKVPVKMPTSDPITLIELEQLHRSDDLPTPTIVTALARPTRIPPPGHDDKPFKPSKRPQFLAATVAAFGFFALGNAIAWSSPAIPDLNVNSEFNNLSHQQNSWLAAFVPLGGFFGGPIGGYGIGKYGRQRTLLICSFPFTIGWVCIALAHTMTMMNFGRFLTGVCCGIITLAMPIYATEVTQESIRGMATSSFASFAAIGIIFTYAVGSFVSWQVLTIISACIPPIYCAGLYFLPESPVFLLQKGQKKHAAKALMWFRGAKSFYQIEAELKQLRSAIESNISRRLKAGEYFTSDIIRPTCISMVLMLLQQFSGVSMIIYYCAEIFSAAGTSVNPQLASITLSVVFLLGNISFSLCVDKIGRRFLLFGSAVSVATSLLALGYFFFAKLHKDPIIDFISWLPLIALIVYSVGFNLGFGPLPWLLMAELIPTHVKGMTATVATSFNWLLAFVVIKSFEDLNYALGIHGTYWLFAGVSAIGGLFVYLFVPETKGKRLDEIQQYFKAKVKVTTANDMI